MEAVVANTSGNACVINLASELDLVAPGKLADIVIMDSDPIADITVLQRPDEISLVMEDGPDRRSGCGRFCLLTEEPPRACMFASGQLRSFSMAISALVFDAYGTLYDVQSVLAKAEQLCPGRGELITQIWRLKQLEYTWLRSLMQQYEDFWAVTRAALEFSLRGAGIEPSDAVSVPLMENYLRLDPYPEVPEALAAVAGRRLAILSNGSPSMLEAVVRNSRLDKWIETAISVDRVRNYKPNPACYALAEETLGIPRQDVLFVSSNGFDVAGAKAFGLKVAWIRRGGEAGPAASPIGVSEMFRLLRGRAEELGPPPDHIVSRLTDLPNLL